MEKYKVVFDHNHAVSASRMDYDPSQSPESAIDVKLIKLNGVRTIEWFVVSGWDEKDAMQLANKVINGDFGELLRLN